MTRPTRLFLGAWLVSAAAGCSQPVAQTLEPGDSVAAVDAQDAVAVLSDVEAVAGSDATGEDLADLAEGPETTDVPDSGPKLPDIQPDTGPIPPICPEAKGNCANCNLCPAFPICTLAAIGKPDLKTYPNDCAAMCALNAYNWPQEVGGSVWPTECPACSLCTPADMKKANDQYCVAQNSGAHVTVDHPCEAGCVADAAMKADGVTPNATKGKCQLPCMVPVNLGGGGCANNGQPVCANEDNATYASECQMQHCDLQGCFPAGDVTATSGCVPGKMTKACDGACFDPVKTPNCAGNCDPVCGIKKVTLPNGAKQMVGTSYINDCVATADGAVVATCSNINPYRKSSPTPVLTPA